MNVRSLNDYKSEDQNDLKTTSRFTGGEKSGLAVENPTEADSLFSSFPAAVRGSGPPPEGACRVTLYKNGFTINGGPFRSLDDPENEQFITELKQGYVPVELRGDIKNDSQLRVALEDKRSQIYEPAASPPEPKYTLFSGDGISLSGGSSSNSVTGQSAGVCTDAYKSSCDTTQPTTTLQFRFHDGTRHQEVFSENATFQVVHDYIMTCAPLESGYRLLCGFPPREISPDPNKTLKDADLLGQVIIQRTL